jgi:hypothetical protein
MASMASMVGQVNNRLCHLASCCITSSFRTMHGATVMFVVIRHAGRLELWAFSQRASEKVNRGRVSELKSPSPDHR